MEINVISIFKYILALLLLVSLIYYFGHKNDSFWDTKLYFETDRKEYSIGDTINLTINIESYEEDKVIRVYRNLRNIEVSFSLINNEHNVLNEEWSQSSGQTLPKSEIERIELTPDHSFIKTVQGLILSQSDSVMINFSELNLNVKYSKIRLKRDSIRIHGFCRPINPDISDSLEDYFEPKDIKINVPE